MIPDLEQMLRKRADELRGREQTRWERFYDRLPYRDDIIDWLAMTCWAVAAIGFTFLVWAHTFGGVK